MNRVTSIGWERAAGLPAAVLPLFAFVRRADSNLRNVRFGSMATACGIVASFVLPAADLIALKSSGGAMQRHNQNSMRR